MWLPEDLQLTLLRSLGKSFIPYTSTSYKSVRFMNPLLAIATGLEGKMVDLAYGLPSLSNAVRREIKKLMWRKRTSETSELDYNSDFALTVAQMGIISGIKSRGKFTLKAEVSILDPKTRLR